MGAWRRGIHAMRGWRGSGRATRRAGLVGRWGAGEGRGGDRARSIPPSLGGALGGAGCLGVALGGALDRQLGVTGALGENMALKMAVVALGGRDV